MHKIAVIALQGGVQRHVEALAAAGAAPVEVRSPSELTGCAGLVLPGGESSTLSKLLLSSGLFDAVAERLADGMPAFGTCAGMILLADEVLDGRDDQRSFGAIDVSVRRNAFGRQLDSFEAPLAVSVLELAPATTTARSRRCSSGRRWSSGSASASTCWRRSTGGRCCAARARFWSPPSIPSCRTTCVCTDCS